ncbi:hypothetical protein EJ05DRAFT_504200 [Pseudovirgaria hyperparasitica]|uniref:Uncharacterized protein n=1 Tax=Pseudovirgaria hyperparasitica TaxID=470096 RepID=A0A6A6VXU1_9PEZI|nr:uncharacterized protein EJ05DRAFT_504200 [Pseudovirgaria hyperparasitica]KAF2754087.1 hypothetical protein EJ05DRAFT_504200 [Pseudovirgaria hyperparasitica]
MEEILAHVSAPARRKDDDLYRMQSEAYMTFEPRKRIRLLHTEMPTVTFTQQHRNVYNTGTSGSTMLLEVSASAEVRNERSNLGATSISKEIARKITAIEHHRKPVGDLNLSPTSSRQHLTTLRKENNSPIYFDDTQDAMQDIESQLFPGPSGFKANQKSSGSHVSKDTRESLSPISYLDKGPIATTDELLDSSRMSTQSQDYGIDHSKPIDRAASSGDMTSQLPLSLGLGIIESVPHSMLQENISQSIQPDLMDEQTEFLHSANLRDKDRGSMHAMHNAKILLESEVEAMALPVIHTSTRVHVEVVSSCASQYGFVDADTSEERASLMCKSSLVLNPTTMSGSRADMNVFETLPISVISPLPSTSKPPGPGEQDKAPWPPCATRQLEDLRDQPNLLTVYQPSCINGDVDMSLPGLRGYWTFETFSWDVELQLNFWKRLIDFVSKGHGSDMRIRRGRTQPDIEDASVYELGCVDVWCWAGLAVHIYRLLYVLSDGQIKHSGAKWFTGPGNVLTITVAPR